MSLPDLEPDRAAAEFCCGSSTRGSGAARHFGARRISSRPVETESPHVTRCTVERSRQPPELDPSDSGQPWAFGSRLWSTWSSAICTDWPARRSRRSLSRSSRSKSAVSRWSHARRDHRRGPANRVSASGRGTNLGSSSAIRDTPTISQVLAVSAGDAGNLMMRPGALRNARKLSTQFLSAVMKASAARAAGPSGGGRGCWAAWRRRRRGRRCALGRWWMDRGGD